MKKWDFESEDKEILKLLDKLEQRIIKDYGKPCKRKAVGCHNCRVWSAFVNFKLTFF